MMEISLLTARKTKTLAQFTHKNIEHFLQSQLYVANLLYARSMKTITIITDFIPLSPNIHMQILQTDLYTFPSLVIILLILKTYLLTMYGYC